MNNDACYYIAPVNSIASLQSWVFTVLVRFFGNVAALTGVSLLAFLGSESTTNAKPHNIQLDLKIDVVQAIHLPTGCIASVEYDDGTFTQAFLTDPLCLPHGVKKRVIPSQEQDFHLLDPAVSFTTDQQLEAW